jgi:hypothetical protein
MHNSCRKFQKTAAAVERKPPFPGIAGQFSYSIRGEGTACEGIAVGIRFQVGYFFPE